MNIIALQQLDKYLQSELSDCYSAPEIKALSRIIFEELREGLPAMLSTDKINHLSGSCHKEATFLGAETGNTPVQASWDLVRRDALSEIVERLKRREPVQYVLGRTEFYGLMFRVNPDVLIPRPETEELVEWVLEDVSLKPVSVLDVGTGSGCIAVTLAKKLKRGDVYACDNSSKALAIASCNARENGTEVHFFEQDILRPFAGHGKYDVVVSNPPYVLESEKGQMEENVLLFEPSNALFVPNHSPLLFYERLADLSHEILNPGGGLYFEINARKGEEVRTMLLKKGYRDVELRNDLSGNPRMVRARE